MMTRPPTCIGHALLSMFRNTASRPPSCCISEHGSQCMVLLSSLVRWRRVKGRQDPAHPSAEDAGGALCSSARSDSESRNRIPQYQRDCITMERTWGVCSVDCNRSRCGIPSTKHGEGVRAESACSLHLSFPPTSQRATAATPFHGFPMP